MDAVRIENHVCSMWRNAPRNSRSTWIQKLKNRMSSNEVRNTVLNVYTIYVLCEVQQLCWSVFFHHSSKALERSAGQDTSTSDDADSVEDKQLWDKAK